MLIAHFTAGYILGCATRTKGVVLGGGAGFGVARSCYAKAALASRRNVMLWCDPVASGAE